MLMYCFRALARINSFQFDNSIQFNSLIRQFFSILRRGHVAFEIAPHPSARAESEIVEVNRIVELN